MTSHSSPPFLPRTGALADAEKADTAWPGPKSLPVSPRKRRVPWDIALVGIEGLILLGLLAMLFVPRPMARVQVVAGPDQIDIVSPQAFMAGISPEEKTPLPMAQSPFVLPDPASPPASGFMTGDPQALRAPHTPTPDRRRTQARARHPAVSKTRRPLTLNQCSQSQLQTLPGVGPALARRIFLYRQAHGPFQRVEDLLQVEGIGPKKLAKMRPWLVL